MGMSVGGFGRVLKYLVLSGCLGMRGRWGIR